MKMKIILAVGTTLFISSTLLNLYYSNKFSKGQEVARLEYRDLVIETAYLQRCLEYKVNISNRKLSPNPENDLLVYYSGNSCYSCLERLLQLLYEEFKVFERVQIIVDDSSKLHSVEGYTDVFSQPYNYSLDSLSLLDDLNDVLVLKLENTRIKSVLEFRPEEEKIFKKYFAEHYL